MNQIHNPVIPFNAPIPGGMQIGKMVRVSGSVPSHSHRFAVNLLCGPSGDIALHVCPKFHDKHVVRNSVQGMHWGHEEKHGSMPIHPGHSFELLLLCEHHSFKIAFNGHHFAEFHHRLPFAAVSNIAIDGDVTVHSIIFDGGSMAGGGGHMGLVPPVSGHVPPAMGHVPPHMPPHVPHAPHSPHAPHHAPYPTQPGVGIPLYQVPPTIHHSGSPYPHSAPVYPMQPGQHNNQTQPGYYPHSPTSHHKSSLLDKAGMAVAGALGAKALTGGGHKHNKLGVLGGGLGAAVAGAALTGHLNPIKAMKKQAKAQKKAQKKALKYGIPLAGAGIGAYALHKGIHHIGHHGHHGHHRSSSSSSSSSSD